jgi:hypothetical protein
MSGSFILISAAAPDSPLLLPTPPLSPSPPKMQQYNILKMREQQLYISITVMLILAFLLLLVWLDSKNNERIAEMTADALYRRIRGEHYISR